MMSEWTLFSDAYGKHEYEARGTNPWAHRLGYPSAPTGTLVAGLTAGGGPNI